MKKNNIIKSIILVFGVLILVCCFIWIIFKVILPSDKFKVLDYTYFISVMKEYNCDVTLVSNNDPGIDYYYITDDNTCPYVVSYTVFNNNNYRDTFYNNLVYDVVNNNFNKLKTSSININFKDNYYIERSTDGIYYKTAVLNKNSVLYINVLKKDKDIALEIQNRLGYYYDINWNKTIFLIISLILIIITIFGFCNYNRKKQKVKKEVL